MTNVTAMAVGTAGSRPMGFTSPGEKSESPQLNSCPRAAQMPIYTEIGPEAV
jgi:hypothetical protein